MEGDELTREQVPSELTALRKRVAELETAEAELHAVIDSINDAILVADLDGNIVLVNGAGARLLGLLDPSETRPTLTELPGRLRIRRIDGSPIALEEMAMARALAGQNVGLEDRLIFHGQSQRDVYMRTNASPVRDDEGKIIGTVAVVRDVTDIVELDKLKDEFMAVAAHELRTPVTIMKGYAQVLLRTAEDMPTTRQRMLQAIDRGADRIDRIVRDLLDISRLQLGYLSLASETIGLADFVKEVVDRMAMTTTRHDIRIVRLAPGTVQGDRDRLEQVLINLLSNAIKYSPQGGDIQVDVAIREGQAVVSVKDHGVGIPKEKQANISERFYRAHNGTPHDYGGMGVGLYISREIISRHNGRLWFESNEGAGSTFYFSLPLQE